MRKVRYTFAKSVITLILGSVLLIPTAVLAGESRAVVDQAEILSDEEELLIEQEVQELSEEWKQDFVVVTTQDAQGKDSESYADDYYDEHGYQENGVLYLVDLENGNVWISTSGTMIRFLTDERIEAVIDAGYDSLSTGSYGEGFLQMLKQTDIYMEAGIPDNQYTYDTETGEISRHRSITGAEILIALAAAAGCAAAFVLSVHASYKMKHGTYSYPFRERGRLDLIQKEDRFVNQVVTRRKIPKDPPPAQGGGGRSSVHRSSGGRSHGGGGRSL